MAAFRLGVVSNCWAAQLPGTSLSQQCAHAVDAGFEYVELRQRALGGCETPRPGEALPWPEPDALAGLAEFFPELGFNLALEAPYFSRPLAPGDPYMAQCVEAALALGGAGVVLRFVDLTPAAGLPTTAELDGLADSIAGWTQRLAQRGVGLALENCRQPVATLSTLLDRVAARLPAGVARPRLCWDPANQVVQSFSTEDPVETARNLPLDDLFEFHFKQVSAGAVLPGMGPGDLDWAALLGAMQERGFQGPALFEIPPGEDVWDRLEAGAAWVRALLSGSEVEG